MRHNIWHAPLRHVIAAALAFGPTAVWAQETPPAQSAATASDDASPPADVVVTGSRIRGAKVVGSVVVTADRALIGDSGAATTSELMRQVPQVINLGADESHRGVQGGQGNTTFASGVNIRGIGANTTLLLLDGRRIAPSGARGVYFDPSVMPTIAVEHVEVIPDGASALYGSDAIAGVVNVISRRNFTGLETNAQYGFARDYQKYSAGIIGGFGWGSGHLMIAAEYTGHTALAGVDRDYYTSDLRAMGGGDYRTNLCNPGTLVTGGQNYALGGATLVAGTINKCDDAKLTDLLPQQSRYGGTFAASQSLGDNIELFANGFWSRRDFKIIGLLKNSVTTGTLTVPNTNAYYRSPTASTSVTVNYRLPTEFGLSYQDGFSEVWQATAGATLTAGAWKISASATIGRNHDLFRDNNLVNSAALTAALASSNPATALNPFVAGVGQPLSVYDTIRRFSTNHSHNYRDVYAVSADGPLFSLPGGEVRIAIGAEHLEDYLRGYTLNANDVRGQSGQGRRVDSIYAEALVPIFSGQNAVPGFQRLELSLAGRYDRYSDVGETKNPKVGLTWTPTSGLDIKGSYGTSFRAPNLGDINPVPLNVYQRTLVDPSSPTGMSVGILYSGGNAALKPETATTWSFGFDVHPAAVPGLHVSLNRFSVDYRNQVVALYGLASVLLQNSYYSQYIQRNPTLAQVNAFIAAGIPNGVITPSAATFLGFTQAQNLGVTIARGFDYELSWRGEVGPGRLDVGAFVTQFTQYDTAPAAGAPLVDQLNLINNPPRFRGSNRLAYDVGAVRVGIYHNWIGAFWNDTVTPRQRVRSQHTFDLVTSWRLPAGMLDGTSLTLNINNVFDQDPAYVNITGGFDAQTASPIGRMISLTLSKRW